MQITRFSLNQLVTEVADLYRSQDPRTRIRLELDEHVESIEADRGRVRQILNNLVTNALEALDGVSARAAGDHHAPGEQRPRRRTPS